MTDSNMTPGAQTPENAPCDAQVLPVPGKSEQVCVKPEQAAPVQKLSFSLSDRLLLLYAWLLGWFFIEVFNATYMPALGLSVLFTLGFALLFFYIKQGGALNRAGIWMTGALWLLSVSFMINVNTWMTAVNLLVLLPLSIAAALVLNGSFKDAWKRPDAVFDLIVSGFAVFFSQLDKPFRAFFSLFGKHKNKRSLTAVLSVAVSVPLVLTVMSLLSTADSIFGGWTDGLLDSLDWPFLGRPAAGALLGIFVYGTVYALSKRKCAILPKADRKAINLDPIAPVILICALNLIYALFAYVQFAYLFGGLSSGLPAGFSYAEYARSGFFELVRVSMINLAVLLSGTALSDKNNPLWKMQRSLSLTLAGFTGLLLFSAAWRMYMYVNAYGFTRLRALTVWGMALILLLLTASVYKLLRPEFRYFPFFLATCMSAWLALNFINIDGLIARYNVDAYLSGRLETIDVNHLVSLSPAGIPALIRLSSALEEKPDPALSGSNLPNILNIRQGEISRRLSDWRCWDLTSQLALFALNSR